MSTIKNTDPEIVIWFGYMSIKKVVHSLGLLDSLVLINSELSQNSVTGYSFAANTVSTSIKLMHRIVLAKSILLLFEVIFNYLKK